MSIAYLNGEYSELDTVSISPLDRGFLFGDGVYEVIPCYGGRPFRLDQHLGRLERSLAATRIDNPYTRPEWRSRLEELVKRNNAGDQLTYVQVTRGVAPRDHAFPGTQPTVFAMSREWAPARPSPPASAVTREDNRWDRCDIKSIALLGNVLLRQEAIDAGATECLLLREHLLTEGAASNVFVIKDGQIKTPPKSPMILAGITRDVVLELLDAEGLTYQESPISETELREADEIWITSSSMELRSVVQVDGAMVGGGQPGPVWMKVFDLFSHCTNS